MEHELLKIRTKITHFDTVKKFFKYHTAQFDTEFFNNYRKCAAHCKSYGNVVKKNLHEITLGKLELYYIPNFAAEKVFLQKEDKEIVETGHEIHKTTEIMETDNISKKQQRIL